MFSDPLFILVVLAALSTLAVLVLGLLSFAKSGGFHKRNANKIMRWRVGLQFLTVALFMTWVYFTRGF
ncbi:MAG: twin transmembrane helix small protein [Rhodobacteraceae bacterium]|nr:twin transmembrane helix small protein [Paracoccaceae bacterium]